MDNIKIIILFVLVIVKSSILLGNDYFVKLQPDISNFYLVLDKSGSMSGLPLDNAKEGAISFISNTKSTDNVGVITFGSEVNILSNLSNDKRYLTREIKNISSAGSTMLYDGIATAITKIRNNNGNKIIVFLTDGGDTGSSFSVTDLYQMNNAENIFVYGIGLGLVNHSGIRGIAEATGGTYTEVTSDTELNRIYTMVLDEYYRYNAVNLINKGQITVKTLPSGIPVYLNDELAGISPISLRGVKAGDHNIKVNYKKGVWERDIKVKENFLTVIESNEIEVPGNLTIGSKPGGASIFIDGTYVGMTGLIGRAVSDEATLKVRALPPGKHTLKIIAVPDFELSESQVWEFEFDMNNNSRHVLINVFHNNAQFDDGEIVKRDPMENINSAFEMFDNSW